MSDRMLVATRKGLFTITRGRREWSIADVAFLGDNCSMTMHDPRDGAIYAALGHGHFGCKLHRSRDGGKTWEAVGMPTYPEKPADYKPAMNPPMGTPVDWSLKLIWELRPGGPGERGKLWCGTLPGGLFSSDDFGATWQLNRPLWDDPRREEWFGGGADYPGIHSVCVDPRDPRMVSVGISCGGVWQTPDSGQSWTLLGKGLRAEYMPPERAMDQNIQDPHLLVQCPGQPEAFWVQHHNGMFRSRDGAQTFTELTDVKPSNFGFAVAVHPRNPDTAWFVPAVKDEKRIPASGKVMVNRTRDGGKSSSSSPTACRSTTPTTWYSGTRWTSTPAAKCWRSARRRARCGRHRTAATRGRRSQRICRRCTACGSRDKEPRTKTSVDEFNAGSSVFIRGLTCCLCEPGTMGTRACGNSQSFVRSHDRKRPAKTAFFAFARRPRFPSLSSVRFACDKRLRRRLTGTRCEACSKETLSGAR